MDNIDIIARYLESHGFDHLRPKAALFDMDGTLYDSMPNHAKAWTMMTNSIGIEVSEEEIFLNEGRTGASTINALFNRVYGRDATPEEIKTLYGIKSENFKKLPSVKPMPGAQSLMRSLQRAGIKRVLVTGSGQSSLISRLDTDFPDAFRPELRITAANTEHSKPHPDPYLKAMKLAAAEPWQSIAFENAPLGVESAARSGAFTVAVVTGPIPKEVLADAGASIVYNSMEECAKLFPELLLLMYKP